jgi:hypothetical protein
MVHQEYTPSRKTLVSTGVNFINVKRANVLFGSFSNYVLALAPKFRTKNTGVNVDEIDGRPVAKADVVLPKKAVLTLSILQFLISVLAIILQVKPYSKPEIPTVKLVNNTIATKLNKFLTLLSNVN